MAAIHQATMKAAGVLNRVETIPQQDSASNMLNKLARTFAAQLEALKRYRSSGEQRVRVTHQHVNVAIGPRDPTEALLTSLIAGQAVVGIGQGGGGAHENASQSRAPSGTDELGPALLGHEQALRLPMPGPGSERPECVPHAWGTGGGPERESKRGLAARDGHK
jgi:hypothetical protein